MHEGVLQPLGVPKQILVREDHGMRRFDGRVDLGGRIGHLAGAASSTSPSREANSDLSPASFSASVSLVRYIVVLTMSKAG